MNFNQLELLRFLQETDFNLSKAGDKLNVVQSAASLKTTCIGFWMSPLMKIAIERAKDTVMRIWRYFGIVP